METIANETEVAVNAAQEAAPPGGDEPVFDFPLSGRILEPTPLTRTLAEAVGDPFDVTVTAAPRYTGLADQVMVRRSWKTVAQDLAKAGVRRADHSSHRGEVGARLREPVQDQIRRLWEEAVQLGMPVQAVADLLGVSRQAAYNIIQGKVAGKGGSGATTDRPRARQMRATTPLDPVKWPQAAHEAHRKASGQTD
jgi:hypothetical protein